jgi:hypothetical protein
VGWPWHGTLSAAAGQFHLGGHFDWANRVFVAEAVAPLLRGGAARAAEY